MTKIKLFGYCTSPYVRKVGAFLMYKGVDFEFVGISPFEAADKLSKFDGTQVPVLEIGDEWKRDSTPIGLWLDELYPEKRLVPEEEVGRSGVLELDRWVSERFMPSIFRNALDAELNLDFRRIAWRLAALVSSHSPMPEEMRHNWPNVLKSAQFIQEMKPQMNMEVDAATNRMQLAGELVERIGDGPFLGARTEPSIADLSIFPQAVFGIMGGLEENLSAAALPPVKAWLQRVAQHLPANPTLIPDAFIVTPLEEALA